VIGVIENKHSTDVAPTKNQDRDVG
jgi:hypothetical protein